MTQTITQDQLDAPQEPQEDTEAPEVTQDAPDAVQESQDEPEDDQETFPREYVEKLRQENGKFRLRAQESDALAHRLHVELVKATGRLADPEDLDFNADHLEDPDALSAAVNELIARKPHLASRRPRGDVGQGRTSGSTGNVDLAALMRSRA